MSLPFDIQAVSPAKLSDLTRRLFEEDYLLSVGAETNGRYAQQLAACNMVAAEDAPTPTVLGLLALSARARDFLPGAYVQFLRIDGEDYDAPITDEALFDGHLSELLRRLEDKLASHNWIAGASPASPVERRRFHYPIVALQQLARNAILHRNYGTNAPVRVYWFNNRLEILNPGGPFGRLTRENFGQPGITNYRNPNLAEALRVFGFVQKCGSGIQLARKELAKNGNPELEFELSPQTVLCRIRLRTCL